MMVSLYLGMLMMTCAWKKLSSMTDYAHLLRRGMAIDFDTRL
jgi:hypothetical protein